MKRNQLRIKIEEAKKRLAKAEAAMAMGLEHVEPARLTDTTIISGALRTALAEVTMAKSDLADLEELVPPEA
jgi:hypothetical protein